MWGRQEKGTGILRKWSENVKNMARQERRRTGVILKGTTVIISGKWRPVEAGVFHRSRLRYLSCGYYLDYMSI